MFVKGDKVRVVNCAIHGTSCKFYNKVFSFQYYGRPDNKYVSVSDDVFEFRTFEVADIELVDDRAVSDPAPLGAMWRVKDSNHSLLWINQPDGIYFFDPVACEKKYKSFSTPVELDNNDFIDRIYP